MTGNISVLALVDSFESLIALFRGACVYRNGDGYENDEETQALHNCWQRTLAYAELPVLNSRYQ
jgi:hypothetical protein